MIEKRKKNKRIAFWGTISFSGIVLLLLIFFGFSIPLPLPEEEGILVNLGYDDAGSGAVETSVQPAPEPVATEETPATTPPKTEEQPTEEEVMTQDFEEAAAMEEQKKKEQKKREEELRKQREREEAERKQRELEQKRRQENAERKKIEELTKNAFSQGGKNDSDSQSDGNKDGTGNQGDPEGDPNANNYGEGKGLGDKGIGYSLKGRSPQGGKLPKPNYTANESGTVVVRVTVDQNGNITSASYQAKGSTTTSQNLIKAALVAARKARFNTDNNADAYQVGTITYHFRLQ
ncbi:MAG: TonB family protein [Salinivirgaceae bacterium]|jgi:colicin import membrane protein|nr:TonB family protein [Salinivirgaceae bacterium]